MPTRDDFRRATKELIARRAGYICSNLECMKSTVGPGSEEDGCISVGVAAHITAAAVGGPRYYPALTPEERRQASNGIWLCQNCAKLIDSDVKRFTIAELRKWKAKAEENAFLAIATDKYPRIPKKTAFELDEVDRRLIKNLQLPTDEDLEAIADRLRAAARIDIDAFRSVREFPAYTIPLSFRYLRLERDAGSLQPLTLAGLAAAIDTLGEMSLVAAPGTGKTTTLVQTAEAILSSGASVAVLVPLAEWSSRRDCIFGSLVRRNAFRGFREQHFMLLAVHGRLVLLLDGWNELDSSSRSRGIHELTALRRDFPLLNMVVSTRRQSRDAPVKGPTIEIEALSQEQQLEIAQALRSDDGLVLLDHAWRTPGVRELVSIPLCLNALLTFVTSSTMPSTKEEVLRLFVNAHERLPERAEVLDRELLGHHRDILVTLAAKVTHASSTVIQDCTARATISQVGVRLVDDGQITMPPEPKAVLDVLVNLHILIRFSLNGNVSFQHQQFQEWYASFYVEELILNTAKGNEDARKKLQVDVLDMPAWEEPVLFACDRLSRENGTRARAVAVVVLITLSIDPMLAAEIVFRAGGEVGDVVRDELIAFAERWHKAGTVDRALRFMITTGRPEFARHVWPLLSNPDAQVHLAVTRAARRFRPSVLGSDVQVRIATMPEGVREHVIAEIADRGGIEGLELATRLARSDPSASVQCAVIEALCFRHADRFVIDLLKTASDRVWQMLAQKEYGDHIADPEAATRLKRERQAYIEAEGNAFSKIGLLLNGGATDATSAEKIARLITSKEFPARDHETRWVLARTFEHYPDDVAAALLQRIEAGREVPFGSEDLLKAAPAVDDGAIPRMVMDCASDKQLAQIAAAAVGPETVGVLIDKFLAHDAMLQGTDNVVDEPTREKYYALMDRISATRIESFLPALYERCSTKDPHRISILADLLARHGKDAEARPLRPSKDALERVAASIHQWVETLLASPAATRHQFANLARAIERLPKAEFVDDLRHLLAEDLKRWKRSREEFPMLPANLKPVSDAHMSYTLQYRRALAAVGNDEVARLVEEYLTDLDFGFDAACVLLDISKVRQNVPKQTGLRLWPDFSRVRERRAQRQEEEVGSASSLAEPIFVAIEKIVDSNNTEKQQRHALGLGKIGLSMPHGDKGQIIDALLKLPLPTLAKHDLLATLVHAGYTITAGILLDGANHLLEAGKEKPWMLGEDGREIRRWLELVPFSDRPAAALEMLELIDSRTREPWRLQNFLEALRYAPDDQAEWLLGELAHRDPRFLREYTWLKAVAGRNTASSGMLLLDLICEGKLTGNGHQISARELARELAGLLRSHPELRANLTERYQTLAPGPGRSIVAAVIRELADPDGLLTLVGGYAAEHRCFDGMLRAMIEDVALRKDPVGGSEDSYKLYGVDITELRRQLFSMLVCGTERASIAEACLTAIDEVRDEYGRVDTEPRHPDITSGRPWPLAAQG